MPLLCVLQLHVSSPPEAYALQPRALGHRAVPLWRLTHLVHSDSPVNIRCTITL